MRLGILHSTSKWLIYGTLIGICSACLALIFLLLVDLGNWALLESTVGYVEKWPSGEPKLALPQHPTAFNPWLLLAVLGVGGTVAGLIVHLLIGEEDNSGDTDYVVNVYHRGRGMVSVRYWLAKFTAAIVTMMSGGSVGREGPIILSGGTAGSLIANRARQPSRNRRIMLVAGAAGGIAAAFQAPLAGALYAGEVLYSDSDLDADTLIPAIISAIVGYCTFGLLEMSLYGGHGEGAIALFHIPALLQFGAGDFPQLVGYALVAIGGVLASWAMRGAFPALKALYARIPLPFYLRCGLGALTCGLLAILALRLAWLLGLVPAGTDQAMSILGPGYGILQNSFDYVGGTGELQAYSAIGLAGLMGLIGLFKILASAATVGSGCSGGIFGPSMVIGGCVGGAIGFTLQGFGLPIAPPPAACVVMGMGAILAANFKAPLASLLMVCELTGSYHLLLPAMWVSAIAFQFSGRHGLIAAQVGSAVDSPAHQGHFFSDILATISVAEVFDRSYRAATLHPDSSLDACKRLVTDTQQNIYPVVDDHGQITGLFTMNDLRGFLYDDSLGLIAVAQDFATTDIVWICENDSLATAIRRFTDRNVDALPVVMADDDMTFIGLLERRAVIAHYNRTVEEMRRQRREEGWEDATTRDFTQVVD